MQETLITWIVGIFGVFILAEIGALIYFIGKTEAVLSGLKEKLGEFNTILQKHDDRMYTATDAVKDFALRDQRMDRFWERQEKLELIVKGVNIR